MPSTVDLEALLINLLTARSSDALQAQLSRDGAKDGLQPHPSGSQQAEQAQVEKALAHLITLASQAEVDRRLGFSTKPQQLSMRQGTGAPSGPETNAPRRDATG